MPRFQPPDTFDFSRPSEWPEWRQRFTRFRTASKLTDDSGPVQVSTLIYAMGADAEHIFTSFVFPEETDKDQYDIVLTKFNDYFVPRRNIIHERAVFYQRVQRQGESVESFIHHLYELAETCDFADTKSEHIRDRIVIGILDKDLSQQLQMKADLTLESATQMVRQADQLGQAAGQCPVSWL